MLACARGAGSVMADDFIRQLFDRYVKTSEQVIAAHRETLLRVAERDALAFEVGQLERVLRYAEALEPAAGEKVDE